MEEHQDFGYVVIVSSTIVIFAVISFLVFVIIQKRKQHSLKTIIEILEKQNNTEIERIKTENEYIKQENEGNSREIQKLQTDLAELRKELKQLQGK